MVINTFLNNKSIYFAKINFFIIGNEIIYLILGLILIDYGYIFL